MKNAFGDEVDAPAPAARNAFGDTTEALPVATAPAIDPGVLFGGVQNWDKQLPRATVAAVDLGLDGSDKATGRMRAANISFLADRYKTTPDDVVSRLPDYQKQYDAEVLKTGKTYDDAGFYGAIGGQIKKENEEQTNFGALTSAMHAGLLSGQSFNQAFEAAAAAQRNAPGWDDSRADLYRQAARGQWNELKSKGEYYSAPIAKVAAYLAEADQPEKTLTEVGQKTSRRSAVIDLLSQYPSDDAGLIMDLAAGQAAKIRAAADEGMNLIEKGARRVERGTMDFLQGFVGTGQEIGRRIGTALGEDQGQAAGIDRRRAQIARQIDERVHGQVDPLKGSNWAANALLSTAEMAPKLASFLTPAGIVANGIATKEEMRGQYEDAGLSASQADTLSYFTGAAATALNFVGAKMVFGRVPFASKVFEPIESEAGLGFVELAKRAAIAAGIELPTQFGIAKIQTALPDAVQWIGGAFDKQLPGLKLSDTLQKVGSNNLETLTGLIPIVLFGAGMATFHDRAAGMAYVQNKNALLALGFHPDTVEAMMDAHTPEQLRAQIAQKHGDMQMFADYHNALATRRAAVEELDRQSREAAAKVNGPPPPRPPDESATAHSFSAQVAAKYPDVFNLLDSRHGLPIEIQAADGSVYPALLNGYWDPTMPSIGRQKAGGWSHGMLYDGEKIITPVPDAAEWLAGKRDVFGTEAPKPPVEATTPDTPPDNLGPDTVEGDNPNPTESPPGTQPPFISDEERAAAKDRTAWSRIAGSLRKINNQIRTLGPGAESTKRKLLEKRLEIQADADIPGARDALAKYLEAQGQFQETPDLGAAVRRFVVDNPLRKLSAKSEGAGELRAFAENLSDKDRRAIFRKDGKTPKLDRYATDLVEHLQGEGIPGFEGDPEAVAQALFGTNETGVLNYIAEKLATEHTPPDVPFIKGHGPDEGRLGLHRVANGDYVVSDEDMNPIGTAKSAEEAAQIAIDHHEGNKPQPLKVFQGRGATPEEVYGADAVEQGRAVPLLGPGEYFANTAEEAANYGADVTPHEVTLQKPFVIDSDLTWRKLLKDADAPHLDTSSRAFAEHPENVPDDAAAVREYLRSKGYDGVIVRNTEQNKRLQESFGHDQVVRYSDTQEEARANRAAAANELASPDQTPEEDLGSVIPSGPNRPTLHPTRKPGQEGKASSADVKTALVGVLEAGGQSPNSLRFGRVPKRMRASGYYNTRSRIIRIQTANNLETSAHEVAHGIEDSLWGIGNVWQYNKSATAAAKAELTTLGAQLYGNRKPAGGLEAEGFAEFYRLYTFDPAKAKQKAPLFFDTWENTILANPAFEKLRAAVKEAQRLGVTFYEQGAQERGRQGIIQQPGRLENAREFTMEQLQTFRRKWIDAAAPVQDLVDEANARSSVPIETENDPFQTLTARRLTAPAITAYMVDHGMLDFAGNVTGPPLRDAFAIAKAHGDPGDFIIYLWAKRAAAMWADGKQPDRNPGLARQDAFQILKDLRSPEWDLAAQKVYDWNDGILEYVSQASPDFAAIVKKIRAIDPGFYIPLFREFKALDDRYSGQISTGAIASTKLLNRLRGSGRRIKDPVEGMLAQAQAMIGKAHNKAVLDQIFAIAESTPGLGHLVSEVPRDMVPQRIAGDAISDKVLKILRENESGGMDAAQRKAFKKQNKRSATPNADKFEGDLRAAIDDEFLTFFAPALKPKQNEWPVLPVFRNGETKWFEMDPELYKAVTGMDHTRLSGALDLFLGMPARQVRLGTTGLRASFSLITNPLRDVRTLMMNSQASANPAELFGYWLNHMREGAMHAFSFGKYHSDWADLASRLGVEMAGSLTQDSRPVQAAARKLKRGGDWAPFDVRNGMEIIRKVLQFPETASRLAEMQAVAKDMGWDPSQPLTPEIAAKLATAGKQVTTDFTQAGEYARVVNHAIPFFNAGIQGPVAHIRALKADPMRFMMRGLMGTAAALALWYRNKDEDWWKEMGTNERYLYTYIKAGDELIRIPRSYEVDGFFMAATEALADAWHQSDPRRLKEWFERYAQQYLQIDMVDGKPVPPLPVLPKLIAEQLANRNFFFDRPIVPRGELENVRPEEQYSSYTSNVAIEAGRILGISPRRIDHTINSIFGPVGGDVAALLGRGSAGPTLKSINEPADIPILGTIFQRGGQAARQPESVQNLYDRYEEAIYTQHSKQEKESKAERQNRLMLSDAVKVQAALTLIIRTVPEREQRQQLEALRVSVAHDAVEQSKAGTFDRNPAKRVLEQAKRLSRENKIPMTDAP